MTMTDIDDIFEEFAAEEWTAQIKLALVAFEV